MLLPTPSADLSDMLRSLPSAPPAPPSPPDAEDGFNSGKRGPGYKILVFVTKSAATRHAVSLVKTVFADKCSEILLAYCSQNVYYHDGVDKQLPLLVEALDGFNVRTEIFQKKDDLSLTDALEEYTDAYAPNIVVISSSTLCNEDLSSQYKRTSWSGMTGGPAVKPPRQAFAMKLCQALRTVPVLVVKANSKAIPVSSYDKPSINYMIDLQPTCRHMLTWLMAGLVDAGKDLLLLAVSKAYDQNGVITPAAVRTYTSFNVQCSVNHYKPERRMLKGPPEKCLPLAVSEDDVDILVIQAPRTRDLSPYAMGVLCGCSTNILIFPPSLEATALGQKPLPTEDVRLPRIPSVNRNGSRRISVSCDGSGFGGAGPLPSPLSIIPEPLPSPGISSVRPSPSAPSIPKPKGSHRAQSYSGAGYSYHNQGKADLLCDAALEAMADRVLRRKNTEVQQMAIMSQTQRARSGALELDNLRDSSSLPPAILRLASRKNGVLQ